MLKEQLHDCFGYKKATFSLLEDARNATFGSHCLAEVHFENGCTARAYVRFSQSLSAPVFGDTFQAFATFTTPTGDTAKYCWDEGAVFIASVQSFSMSETGGIKGALLSMRNSAVASIRETTASSEAKAVLEAILCNNRQSLDEESIYDAFKVCGVAHLIAVSGAHFALVISLLSLVLQSLRLPRGVAVMVQLAFMAAYLCITAFPLSALRSALMAAMASVSFVSGRRNASLNALGVCVVVFLLMHPLISVSISFALSACSTLGICLFSPLFSRWFLKLFPKLPELVRDTTALTLAQSVSASPLSIALFSQCSVVGIIVNIAVAPFFPIICGGGIIGVCFISVLPALGMALLSVTTHITQVLCVIIHLFTLIPYACVPASLDIYCALVISAVSSLLLWWIWPSFNTKIALSTLSVFLGIAFVFTKGFGISFATQIIMLDVGQGDAIVIKSGGSSLLIDTGTQDSLLYEGLAEQGIYALDAIIITHPDDDHCGSLGSLQGMIPVGMVCVASDTFECFCDNCRNLITTAESLVGSDAVVGLTVGDRLSVGCVDLEVIWPITFSDEGSNADSLCLLASFDIDTDDNPEWRAFFCGDAEKDQLNSMVQSGVLGDIDIYKVGHHGSKNALTEQLAQTLLPEISLISVGATNSYGHPASKTLDALEDVGSHIFRTDTQGSITCTFTASEISVTTEE